MGIGSNLTKRHTFYMKVYWSKIPRSSLQGILKQVETERDILFAVGEHSNIVRLYAYWLTDVSM